MSQTNEAEMLAAMARFNESSPENSGVDFEFELFKIEYAGFSIDKIRKAVYKKAEAYLAEPNCPDAGKTVEQVVGRDVTKLILLALNRGTKHQKIARQSDKDRYKEYPKLISRYGVLETGKDKGSEVITLSRLTAAFAYYTARCLIYTDKKSDISAKTAAGVDIVLPHYLRFTSGGSLIPSSDSAMRDEFKIWSIAHSKLYNNKYDERYVNLMFTSGNDIDKAKSIAALTVYAADILKNGGMKEQRGKAGITPRAEYELKVKL